jgi:tRNA modification GTPase
MAYVNDTIAALATAPGAAGVAIIRLSGPAAGTIGERVASGLPKPRSARLVKLKDAAGSAVDRGLVLWFPGPASFTGEDVVEFHCHGGQVVPQLVLSAALDLGARLAEPGEFSLRGFWNDKLDLVQAEAIADLVNAGSERAARAALRSLEGAFSSQVQALTQSLIALRVEVEAGLDFPDEELELLDPRRLTPQFSHWRDQCQGLLDNCQRGRALRDGLSIVIAGPPNAGKSSLLNRLSGYEAAIVTEIPGTTRDTIRVHLDLDGLPLEVIDTAGLRSSVDPVEAEGMRRAREVQQRADQVLWVADIRDGLVVAEQQVKAEGITQACSIVLNKVDLTDESPGIDGNAARPLIRLSALTGVGMSALADHLKSLAGYGSGTDGSFTARARHVRALETADQHVSAAMTQASDGALELAAEELRAAQVAINGITGEFTNEDLLGEIFSSFCIGK